MPHLDDEVADFIWVGWPGTVHGCGDEGWRHIVAENHLRPGLQPPVELGDVIVLYENKWEHGVEKVPHSYQLHLTPLMLCKRPEIPEIPHFYCPTPFFQIKGRLESHLAGAKRIWYQTSSQERELVASSSGRPMPLPGPLNIANRGCWVVQPLPPWALGASISAA